VGAVELRAAPDVQHGLIEALRQSGTLYAWAAGQPQRRALRGRAPVYVATLPLSGDQVAVRHAWHGGLLAPLTGDRFRRPTRAPREYQLSHALRAAGVPTTDIVGFACYPAGPGLARVDVVSRYLPDAVDLGEVLSGRPPAMPMETALEATTRLLTTLARHGIVHPDLNAKNILVRPLATDGVDALMIDVDVIAWDPSRAPRETMARNVARLTRSLRKARRQGASALSEAALAAFATRAHAAADPIAMASPT
jgi:3-deoxy-D-manno-octulosonic acid kinase